MADKFDATIITGSLDGKELENSIDALVKSVSGKTDAMATEFVKSIDKMKLAMKDFALTQKVSVDLMKEAWRNMSSSFDAMVAAQTNATSGGSGKGGSKVFAPNTVGELEQSINALKLQRKELELNSDELRRQNAELERRKNLLSQQTKGVATQRLESATNMSSSNLNDAERKLRLLEILQRRYANTTELSVAQQNKLARAIQQTKDQIDRIKPKSLRDVLGMDENGIDAITKKMQALKRVQVAPNSPEATTLANEYQRLKKLQNDLLGQNAQLVKSNNYLAQSFGYIRNRIVYALTLGAMTNFTKQIYEVRGQYELLERSLGVLVNSFQKGSQIFQELNDMAIKSPFTLMELATAAKQLTAYNFAADEVVDTTRRLADISAALGVPMERLTYNLGQIRAQTVLTARDARDFANAGLPMVKTLADYYTELEGRVVSTGDVYDRMSKKMVSYNDVMAVLTKMTDEGGKFFDFQAKQAETLKVQMNNLTLAWNNMLNEIGKDNQGMLELPLKGLRAIFENWESINRALTNLALILGTAKVAQLAFNMALGKGNIEQLRSITLMPNATAQNYQNALSKMEITKAQAKLMIATNRTNVALRAAIVNMGTLTLEEAKAAATTNVLRHSWMTTSNIMVAGFEKIGKGFMALVANPATWFFAISYAATDLFMAFKNASEAADELNETIGKNTKENAESIGKFLSDYAKSFDKLRDGKMEQAEQVKLWEAIREEIKKSSQNADEYISKLERMTDLSEKNKLGGDILSEIKQIQESANAAQEQNLIKASESVWGGLVQHGVVEQLKDLTDEINDALSDAEDDFDGFASKYQKIIDVINNPNKYVGGSFLSWEGQLASDTKAFSEEFDKFTQSIADSMEKMWNPNVEKNTANVREYVNTIVKAYKEAHPEIKGQVERVFDMGIDRFVANQIQTFAHVTDQNEILLQNTYSAWQVFYEKLRSVGGREFDSLMEYITKTGNYSNKELEEIWKKAAESMKREAGDAYMTIDKYIADLNTKQVIIPIFFQQKQIQGDNLQKDFEGHFIEDGLSLYKDFEAEQQERLKRTRLYKDLNKKDGEDTVKWNKRLNDLYNDDLAKIAKQDEIMSKITDKESVRYKEARATKDFYEKQVGAIKEVVEYEGFSLEQKKKNGRKGSQRDEILDALKKEIELIKKAQSEYETLTKKGASSTDALASAQSKFGKTISLLNSKLSHWGLPTIDLRNIVKGDPNKTLAFFEKVKKALETKGLSNVERMKAVEVVIDEFDIKAKSFNLDKITKGLNNELGKLKDEYELAVELDANPELGSFFADMIGINMDNLPRTVEAYAEEYTKLLNKYLKEKNQNIELPHLDLTDDDLTAFDQMVKDLKLSEEAYEEIKKAILDVREKRKKDFDETRKEYEALIKKYGEYEAKIAEVRNTSDKERLAFAKKFGAIDQKGKAISLITDIQVADDPTKKAELRQQLASLVQEIAKGDDTKIRLQTTIDMKGLQEEARINFEEYQKTPEWVLATGNISDLTHNALSKLIADLEQYKKKAKYLDDKQIKKINNALKALHKQTRKDNPFLAMGDSMDEARERMALFQPELDSIMKQIVDLEKEISNGKGTDKQIKKLAELKKRWKEVYDQQQEYGKVSATVIVSNINNAISVAKQASSAFNEMAEALGGKNMTEAAQTIQDVTSILEKGGEGAAAGAQIGGGYGAIIGAAAGVLQGVITTFADRWSGNAAITEKIVESQREVKKLTMLYKQLENAIEDAYGQGEMRAKALLVENKKLQLAELEHQLALERSRKSKNRDEDKIIDLQEQVDDAKQELKELADGITESFLGISSVKDAVSSMVDDIVGALKSGENAMDKFTESWEEMCWNMIKQVVSTEILAPKFKKIFDSINEDVQERGKKQAEDINRQKQYMKNVETDQDRYIFFRDPSTGKIEVFDSKLVKTAEGIEFSSGYKSNYRKLQQTTYEDWVAQENKTLAALEESFADATRWTVDDLKNYAETSQTLREYYESTVEATEAIAREIGLTMGDKTGKLSSLTAGISAITESTANALEAYLNIISQRIFEHGTVFYEIRDIISSWNMDAHLGVQSQMLLQLQNSYQTQMAIQNLLEGTLTPNGRAFSVELLS